MSPLGTVGSMAQSQPPIGAEALGHSFSASSSDFDVNSEARNKRKLDESEEGNGKRSRRKTDSESPNASRGGSEAVPNSHAPTSAMAATRVKPSRRKIEYVPLAREVETAGGRDVNHIQNELTRLSRGLPLRDINEWGKVYVDALTMSLRSCISTELSYGLTTLILLSTMRSAAPDTGFVIGQCEELLDEVLDLLEELAFPCDLEIDPPAAFATPAHDAELVTNCQLVSLVHDEISYPLASEEKNQGDFDARVAGPMQRRADIIRLALNILRNLSAVTDKQAFMARHPILIDLLLRITSETLNPFAWIMQSGLPLPPDPRAPLLPDAALEVFTRISQPDSNGKIFSSSVPQQWLWRLFEALVHRLPSTDHDYKLVIREESWMSYLVLGLYSFAFLMPPEMKQRVKEDRSLSFAKVILRFVKRIMSGGPVQAELRMHFASCARRAIETMKMINDGDDGRLV
ncbi:hypothetical protein DFH11DRAFT_1543222 [Phellopilus nigrolimitatus]|nr:hypothetical protein DFH11DRAFT_1543222 [Phellopilus nigrolimitatus]